jgi:hypothetical protein
MKFPREAISVRCGGILWDHQEDGVEITAISS